jgi:hypothetical protein
LLFLLLLLSHGLAFAGLDTPLPIPSSGPYKNWDCPQQALSPMGLGHFQRLHTLGTPSSKTPMPSHNWDFLFKPWSFTTQVLPQNTCFVGAWPRFPFLELCPLGCLSCAPSPTIFCPLQGFYHDGLDLHWSHSPLSHLRCLTLVLCPQSHCRLGLAFNVLYTPGPLPPQIRFLKTYLWVPQTFKSKYHTYGYYVGRRICSV